MAPAQLGRAKLAYQRGDYGAAVLLLHPLLYPQALLAQEDQVLLAHKLLALSYFFEHDEAGGGEGDEGKAHRKLPGVIGRRYCF